MSIVPNFTDIRYFLEAAQTKNLSRAAERLGLTQPSLSSAIQRLEQSLGTTLFIRSRKGVELTKAGKELQGHGRLLLQDWEHLKANIHKRSAEVSGEYIIGCHPSVALYCLADFLPEILQQHQDLEIKLVHDLSRKITEKVISFEVDFGIVVNPVRHPDLVIKELCTDEVGFWTAKEPTLNQKFAGDGCILICDLELVQVQSLLAELKKRKLVFRRVMHSSNLEVITDLTARGTGVGIIPRRVATRIPSYGLKVLNEALPVFQDKICLIYRADAHRSKGSQCIAEAIVKAGIRAQPPLCPVSVIPAEMHPPLLLKRLARSDTSSI